MPEESDDDPLSATAVEITKNDERRNNEPITARVIFLNLFESNFVVLKIFIPLLFSCRNFSCDMINYYLNSIRLLEV